MTPVFKEENKNSVSVPSLGLAIIGSGSIARTHAAAIEGIPQARLVAVCSRNREKAEELAAPFKARVFDSPPSLSAWQEVDAVLIATASGAHEESAIPALRAGKHVLCEKPLEISTERINRMVAEAEKNNVLLAGFFPMRYGEGAKAIRAALDAERFGRLSFLSARVKWWRKQEYYRDSNWRGTWALDGGGALMNQGIHAVDLLQWMGGPVEVISAYSAGLAHPGIEVEDTLAASLRFKSGALGTIATATSCHPGLDFAIEISGDHGTAVLLNGCIDFWQFSKELPGDQEIRENLGKGKPQGGASDPKAISCEGHRQQISEFCGAIRGQNHAIIDGREAGRAVAIVESAYRSCRSNKSEPINTL